MFGLFGKDWNVVAVIFERRDVYQVSGQRVKGGAADKAREGARAHARCLYWAVFNQKGALLEAGEGAGSLQVHGDVLKRLAKELPSNKSVREVLRALETKQAPRVGRPLAWHGYPPRQMHGAETQEQE